VQRARRAASDAHARNIALAAQMTTAHAAAKAEMAASRRRAQSCDPSPPLAARVATPRAPASAPSTMPSCPSRASRPASVASCRGGGGEGGERGEGRKGDRDRDQQGIADAAGTDDNLSVAALEAKLAALEELGVRGRKSGLRQFHKGPSLVGKVAFAGAETYGGPEYTCPEVDDVTKQLYGEAAGWPSWVPQPAGLKTYPQVSLAMTGCVEFEGEDEDDIAKSRGVRRFPTFDARSNIFDNVMASGRASQASRVAGKADASSCKAEATLGDTENSYSTIYSGAAGNPSWVALADRRKASVGEKMRQKTAQMSRRLLAKLKQDQAKCVSKMRQDNGIADGPLRAPRRGWLMGAPSVCGMTNMTGKSRSTYPEEGPPWCPSF